MILARNRRDIEQASWIVIRRTPTPLETNEKAVCSWQKLFWDARC